MIHITLPSQRRRYEAIKAAEHHRSEKEEEKIEKIAKNIRRARR
jgi:hypothetical protein